MYPGYQSLYEVAISIGCTVLFWCPDYSPHTGAVTFSLSSLRTLIQTHLDGGGSQEKGDERRIDAIVVKRLLSVFAVSRQSNQCDHLLLVLSNNSINTYVSRSFLLLCSLEFTFVNVVFLSGELPSQPNRLPSLCA